MIHTTLPFASKNFFHLSNYVREIASIVVEGESLQIPANDFPEDLLKIYDIPNAELDGNDYQFPILDYTTEYIYEFSAKILKEYPMSALENLFSETLSFRVRNVFDEMQEAIFFYDHRTNFIDTQKIIMIGIEQKKCLYMYYRTLILRRHLPELSKYMNLRMIASEKQDFCEFGYLGSILPLTTHWSLGVESIQKTLLKLDIAVCASQNTPSYAIEEFDEQYVSFSIILTIK